jgi:putative endonuclease
VEEDRELTASHPSTRQPPADGPAKRHFVYIVRCADDSLYVGYARDPRAREAVHNEGCGARYTSGRRPVRLVYTEAFDTIGDALRREIEIKRWTRQRKEALLDSRSAGGSSG